VRHEEQNGTTVCKIKYDDVNEKHKATVSSIKLSTNNNRGNLDRDIP